MILLYSANNNRRTSFYINHLPLCFCCCHFRWISNLINYHYRSLTVSSSLSLIERENERERRKTTGRNESYWGEVNLQGTFLHLSIHTWCIQSSVWYVLFSVCFLSFSMLLHISDTYADLYLHIVHSSLFLSLFSLFLSLALCSCRRATAISTLNFTVDAEESNRPE